MKVSRISWLVASLLLAAPVSQSWAQAVATVNGVAIPKGHSDVMAQDQVAQGQKDGQEMRQAIREELIRREVIAQEAKRKKLDSRAEVKNQMELAAQAVLVGAYLRDFATANKVSDDQVRKEYEAIKAQLGDKEYKVRHILVEKEDEARSVVERLKKGEKFDDLAKTLSKDPGSKDRGGDLGWSAAGAFVKPFSDAMVALGKGKTSDVPAHTEYGYHVIKVEDVRPLKAPSLEEVKPRIQEKLQQQAVAQEVNNLRGKAKVE